MKEDISGPKYLHSFTHYFLLFYYSFDLMRIKILPTKIGTISLFVPAVIGVTMSQLIHTHTQTNTHTKKAASLITKDAVF